MLKFVVLNSYSMSISVADINKDYRMGTDYFERVVWCNFPEHLIFSNLPRYSFSSHDGSVSTLILEGVQFPLPHYR